MKNRLVQFRLRCLLGYGDTGYGMLFGASIGDFPTSMFWRIWKSWMHPLAYKFLFRNNDSQHHAPPCATTWILTSRWCTLPQNQCHCWLELSARKTNVMRTQSTSNMPARKTNRTAPEVHRVDAKKRKQEIKRKKQSNIKSIQMSKRNLHSRIATRMQILQAERACRTFFLFYDYSFGRTIQLRHGSLRSIDPFTMVLCTWRLHALPNRTASIPPLNLNDDGK